MNKFKVGDLIEYKNVVCAFGGKCTDGQRYFAEIMYDSGFGWQRDSDIPSSYVSRGVNKFWFIKQDELWELVEQAKPLLKPKVGEKYRCIGNVLNGFGKGKLYTYLGERRWKTESGRELTLGSIEGYEGNKKYYTTEFFELVDPTDLGPMVFSDPFYHAGIEINETTLKQKTMNFIKKLTQSKEDKALEKAGFMDSCGELTSTGKAALESLLYADKKKDLVALAEEVIEESKE